MLYRPKRIAIAVLAATTPLTATWAQSSIEELPAPAEIRESTLSGSQPTTPIDRTNSILEQTPAASSGSSSGMQSVLEQSSQSGSVLPRNAPPRPMPLEESSSNPPSDLEAGDVVRRELAGADEYEVLMQGPLHEAFAIPEQANSSKFPIVPIAPPAPIDEQPPALQDVSSDANTETTNLQWIGGYWAFSEELGDYVWVSGLYREVPPDRAWVAGTWMETDGGYQWVQGYWELTSLAERTVYLPAPPASIDNGPSSPAPNDNSFWMPGQWDYVGNDYQWKSGYWTAQYDDWIWQPACYQATPRGYIYVSGYWDYEPIHRGIVYPPVFFRQPVYLNPGYRYQPSLPIASTSSLLLHLFVRSGDRHYYFGDFYGDRYTRLGYQPWYRSSLPAFHSASLLGHYQWKYQRQGIAFVDSMGRYDSYFRNNPVDRGNLAVTLPSARGSVGASQAASPFGNSFDAIVRSSFVGSPGRVAPARQAPANVARANAPQVNRNSPVLNAPATLSRSAVTNQTAPNGLRLGDALSDRNPPGFGNTTIQRTDALGRQVDAYSRTSNPRSDSVARIPSSSYGANPTISPNSINPNRGQPRGIDSSSSNLIPQGLGRPIRGSLSTRSPLSPSSFSPRLGFPPVPPGFNGRSVGPVAPPGFSMPGFPASGFPPRNLPGPNIGRANIGPPSFSPRSSNTGSSGLGQGNPGIGRPGFGGRRR